MNIFARQFYELLAENLVEIKVKVMPQDIKTKTVIIKTEIQDNNTKTVKILYRDCLDTRHCLQASITLHQVAALYNVPNVDTATGARNPRMSNSYSCDDVMNSVCTLHSFAFTVCPMQKTVKHTDTFLLQWQYSCFNF